MKFSKKNSPILLRIKKSTIVHHFFQNPMVDCVAATILKTENKKHFTFWRIGKSSLFIKKSKMLHFKTLKILLKSFYQKSQVELLK